MTNLNCAYINANSTDLTWLHFSNDGAAISDTNYWDSPMAKIGLLMLTWNAGTARILVPDHQVACIADMSTSEYCIISQGPRKKDNRHRTELLFEDHTDTPLSIQLSSAQCERTISGGRQEGFDFAVWSRSGLQLVMPGKLRDVKKTPFLQGW
jgi:hypothetical protein